MYDIILVIYTLSENLSLYLEYYAKISGGIDPL